MDWYNIHIPLQICVNGLLQEVLAKRSSSLQLYKSRSVLGNMNM